MAIGYKHFRIKYDYHTHTTFSHGTGSIEDNVKVAVDKGLDGVAVTDHGPGHLTYGIKKKDIPVMRAEVERLRKIYPDISILLGVEANIINKGNNLDITEEEAKLFDYVIAGYHFGVLNGHGIANFRNNLFRKLIKKPRKADQSRGSLLKKNTDMVVKAVMENKIGILTHPGDKGPFDILKIAKACAERGTLMEISSWHEHLTKDEIKIAAKTDVKFIVSSDAHKPARIGDCSDGIKRALDAGIEMSRIVNIEAY